MRALGGVALVIAGSVASALSACGLTANFSGLQGGLPPEVEAGPDGGEVALPDAAGDAPGIPPVADAGDAEVDAATFCESLTTPVQLCADFDEGNPIDAGWGATDTYGGEAIAVVSQAFSPPGAFSSAINPSGAPSSARLLQALPNSSASAHMEFEMLLGDSNDGTIELAAFHETTPDGSTWGLFYREVSSNLQVELKALLDDGGTYDKTWSLGAPPATWTHIVLDMTVAESGSFKVTQDGTVVLSESNVPTSTPTRTALFVEVGLYSFTPTSGQANFDNVILDWP